MPRIIFHIDVNSAFVSWSATSWYGRGDWPWYKQCSDGFITICRSYSPVLQQFSIDECFIDMSLRCTPENAVVVATQLKEQIKSALGFTVNVGIGSNKLLAKMASDFEKPDKVHTLWSSEVQTKMWPLPVRGTGPGRCQESHQGPSFIPLPAAHVEGRNGLL